MSEPAGKLRKEKKGASQNQSPPTMLEDLRNREGLPQSPGNTQQEQQIVRREGGGPFLTICVWGFGRVLTNSEEGTGQSQEPATGAPGIRVE